MSRITTTLMAAVLAAFMTFAPAWAKDWKPAVNGSLVTSYEQYDKLKSEAFTRYQKREEESYGRYKAVDEQEWAQHAAKKRAALMELRVADMGNYLSWLDARELGDYEQMSKLQKSSAALAAFVKKTAESYKIYDDKRRAAYDEFERLKRQARLVYDEEVRLLRAEYDKLPK